ncbi:site-specific integrase [Paenibacillus roseipurpureus]|uniref:Tyrosine-type recombinase/integrase n=1 Tax=Paenibacillus roseopurpureus TaxID=2918901 RepID=A0AA96RJ78_9BACL|nr:tyrosine-type recombinase/integrase [Paenibacillus sp. MBLB1832]WNR43009.1 tyrosine-type recombinase/integrase [Paenibacillus sp. MBLB1832]
MKKNIDIKDFELLNKSTKNIINDILDSTKKRISREKSTNTIRAYSADLDHFTTWCTEKGVNSVPVDDEIFAIYLTSLAISGYKTSTIYRKMSAISHAHIVNGFKRPKTVSIRKIILGIEDVYGNEEVIKTPVPVDLLKVMLSKVQLKLKGTRDKAILLIGFSGALRRSELVAINVEDISFNDKGIEVIIRKSNNNQNKSCEKLVIHYGNCIDTCPARAVQDLITLSGIKSGPLFRCNYRIGSNRLNDRAVTLMLKRYVKAAGFDEKLFSSQSLRSGFIITATKAGYNDQSIMVRSRYNTSVMIRKYTALAEALHETEVKNIGL